jgi:hypothetical protein
VEKFSPIFGKVAKTVLEPIKWPKYQSRKQPKIVITNNIKFSFKIATTTVFKLMCEWPFRKGRLKKYCKKFFWNFHLKSFFKRDI